MDMLEIAEVTADVISQSDTVPRGQVEYRMVVFEDGNRFPIIVKSQDYFDIPPKGENYEVRSGRRTIKGKIALREVVVSHSPNLLATVTTLVLK